MRLVTPISVWIPTRTRTAGAVGATTSWTQYSAALDADTTVSVFWAEWTGSYGTGAVEAASVGVDELCTVRMIFEPGLYAALRSGEAVVIKNVTAGAVESGVPVPSHPDCYQVWGGVDNAKEAGLMMEFKVKRWEGK